MANDAYDMALGAVRQRGSSRRDQAKDGEVIDVVPVDTGDEEQRRIVRVTQQHVLRQEGQALKSAHGLHRVHQLNKMALSNVGKGLTEGREVVAMHTGNPKDEAYMEQVMWTVMQEMTNELLDIKAASAEQIYGIVKTAIPELPPQPSQGMLQKIASWLVGARR